MKKLIVVVLVLLLVSMVTYGADYWYSPNPTCIRPISGYTHVGIGTSNPATELHVNGTALMKGFRLTTGAHSGYVLTSNSSGVGTWQPAPSGGGSCLWSGNTSRIYYNGKVGLKTSSPSARLDIANLGASNDVSILVMSENTNDEFVFKGDFAGSGETGNLLRLATTWGNNAMTWRGDGNVGIGVANPGEKLVVNGNIKIKGSNRKIIADGSGSLIIEGYPSGYPFGATLKLNQASHAYLYGGDGGGSVHHVILAHTGSQEWGYVGIGTDNPQHKLDVAGNIRTEGNIIVNNKVGIGTISPNYKLDVNGTIRAKEIKVETGWSDFVFEDNYQLMPLDKLEKHIKEEKSLPGIPTEKEVLKSGVKVGEMQAKLLEKVEELTLYVIELKKENEELKNRISSLEK
jgi:hypothetical protein